MASHIFVLVDYASWILSMCNQMVRQRGVAKFVRILPERRYGSQQSQWRKIKLHRFAKRVFSYGAGEEITNALNSVLDLVFCFASY